MRRRTCVFIAFLFVGRAFTADTPSPDPGWPRQKTSPDGKLIYYQPHFDQWSNFKSLRGRMAVSLTPTGGQPILGVAEFVLDTDTDLTTHTVVLKNP